MHIINIIIILLDVVSVVDDDDILCLTSFDQYNAAVSKLYLQQYLSIEQCGINWF